MAHYDHDEWKSGRIVLALFSMILASLILSFTDEHKSQCHEHQVFAERKIQALKDSLESLNYEDFFEHPEKSGLVKKDISCPSGGGLSFSPETKKVTCTLPHHNKWRLNK